MNPVMEENVDRPMPPGIASRILWGIRTGTAAGAAFGLLAMASTLLPGAGPSEAHMLRAAAGYVAAGAAGGATLGILRRYARSLFSAALVGTLTMIPVAVAFRFVADRDRLSFSSLNVIATLVTALFVGGLGGMGVWAQHGASRDS